MTHPDFGDPGINALADLFMKSGRTSHVVKAAAEELTMSCGGYGWCLVEVIDELTRYFAEGESEAFTTTLHDEYDFRPTDTLRHYAETSKQEQAKTVYTMPVFLDAVKQYAIEHEHELLGPVGPGKSSPPPTEETK